MGPTVATFDPIVPSPAPNADSLLRSAHPPECDPPAEPPPPTPPDIGDEFHSALPPLISRATADMADDFNFLLSDDDDSTIMPPLIHRTAFGSHHDYSDSSSDDSSMASDDFLYDDASITSDMIDDAILLGDVTSAKIQQLDATTFDDVTCIPDGRDVITDIEQLSTFPPFSLYHDLDFPSPLDPVVNCLNTEDDIFNDQLTDPTVASRDDDFSDDDDDPFPSVIEVHDSPRVSGLTKACDGPRVMKLSTASKDGLGDTGANICMTWNLALLTDVVDIVPFSIGMALQSSDDSLQVSQCTKKGYIHLPKLSGDSHPQICYYNQASADTIISPHAICADSKGTLTEWNMCGNTTGQPGSLRFSSNTSDTIVDIPLTLRNGLYYCSAETFQLARPSTFYPSVSAVNKASAKHTPPVPKPTNRPKQLEAELWSARLGFPAEWQLDVITSHADGLPTKFEPHPFSVIPEKADAAIGKRPSGKEPMKVTERGQRFYMDFGFMRASTFNYLAPDVTQDRIVQSYDGFSSYLAIVDEVSKFVWIFLCKTKEPPTDMVSTFLTRFGHKEGGQLRTDQGGELARSTAFSSTMLQKHNYVVEPTGADSPSQNGQVEKYNHVLGVTVRVLLYSAGLHAKFWSAALLHAAYLHNRRCHKALLITPYEAWYGLKPSLKHLKVFGAKVSVKKTGKRRAKLDRHSFRGIFLGYTATDHNIRYVDINTGITKRSHHAIFDEAWYTSKVRPPAAQFLYDLGLTADYDATPALATTPPQPTAYPPLPTKKAMTQALSTAAARTPLPWNLFPVPALITARAAKVNVATRKSLPPLTIPNIHDILDFHSITSKDMDMVYLSPEPYKNSFVEVLDLRKCFPLKHPTAGLDLIQRDNRLFLGAMARSTPGAKIHAWRSRLRDAWLIQINGTVVTTLLEARQAFASLALTNTTTCDLLFAHSEMKHGLTNDGIPQINLDQLNNRLLLRPSDDDLLRHMPQGSRYSHEFVQNPTDEHDVLNCITKVSKLTRSKLHKQHDWDEWQSSEYLQLDQYELQYMFGDPVAVEKEEAVFSLVWTYIEKVLDKRKKARCTADGSARNGMVRVLDHTYANCVDHSGARIFYAAAAVENLIIFGSDVSNAFGEAPPPRQGCFIRPDKAFRDWWVYHKKRPPIPPGFVIPVLAAIQGHPESPRLWEKYIDRILKHIGFTPTVHEPCLYSGEFDGERVLFMRQVDDFACAAPTERIAGIVMDLVDEYLYLPIKRQGLVSLFNGIDVVQAKHFIKIHCKSYIERITEKYLPLPWMKPNKVSADRPTALPSAETFNKLYLSEQGDPDPAAQAALRAANDDIGYRNLIGELTYAMVTCRPDVSFATVKSAQSSACPARSQYEGVKHTMRYLYITKDDGIYFWRSTPCDSLPDHPLPMISSNPSDLLMADRPHHDPYDLHGFADSDWAGDPKTRRSFSGICLRLAGGTVAYKSRLQPTVAGSSTEAEFISAADAGKMILFLRSILYDLGIPQEAASILYEDNEGCIAMANAGKPTSRTRHIDIKYHSICEWVERDLVILERVPTSQNLSDHFTKNLPKILFHRHVDFILGHVPPPHSPLFGQALCLNPTTSPHTTPSSFPLDNRPSAAAAARVVLIYRCYFERDDFPLRGIW